MKQKIEKYIVNEQTSDFIWYRPETNDLSPIKEIFQKGGHYSFKKNIAAGMLVLDLGAHIGAFTRYCNLAGASCVSFEPEPRNFEMLQMNCDLAAHSGVANAIYQEAVTTSKAEKLTFYFNEKRAEDRYRFTQHQSPGRKGVLQVNNRVVDSLLEMHFDAVKMDVEGSEFLYIDERKIFDCDFMIMEYHFSKDKSMANFRRRVDILRDYFKEVKTNADHSLLTPNYYPNDEYQFFIDGYIICKNRK